MLSAKTKPEAAMSAPAPSLAVTVVTDAAELEALRPEWLDLLERSAANAAMLTPMWLLPWWRTWGPHEGRRLRFVLFREGARLVGLAPMLLRRFWHRGVVPLRRLEPLGHGERHGEQVCSDYITVAAERGREQAVAAAFAGAVAGGRLGGWDELVLPALDGEGPMLPLLSEAFQKIGARVETAPADGSPYATLPATWDDYLKGLASKRRYVINQSIRALENWAGGDLQWRRAGTEVDVEEGTKILLALHAERWQAVGEQGAFQTNRFRDFHAAAMLEMLRAGALELSWLTARGEPVAVLYNLCWNGAVCVYQVGRRMDLPRRLRPGLVLHAYAIRQAIEAGRREYDFLAGVVRYKLELSSAVRPLMNFRAARPSLAETTRRAAEVAVAWAKVARNAVRRRRDEPCQAEPARPENDA